MKKIYLLPLVMLLGLLTGHAQESFQEPEFIGETLLILSDNSTVPLEKTRVQTKTKAGAGVYLAGIGKVHTKISLDGCCAQVRANSAAPIRLIVKAVDNNTDPMSIISVFRFKTSKKNRKAELSAVSTFKGATSNNLDYVPFKAKKYGESSYILELEERPVGEFGIMVSNPNNRDEKQTVVTTFGID